MAGVLAAIGAVVSACRYCGRRDGLAPTFRLLLRANRLLRAARADNGVLRHALAIAVAKADALTADPACDIGAEAEAFLRGEGPA